jgi:UDP-N-acetyl-D-glucosamine dehydrogenase
MQSHRELIGRIKRKNAVVGVIGLGYVGLPLVIRFAEEGFKIIGFDIDEGKIGKLEKGESYIKHIPSERIRFLSSRGRFSPTSDFGRLVEADCIIICVPTPLNANREPDLGFIEATTSEVAKHLRKGQLISLESTTYPGTTREVLLPRLSAGGLSVGKDFFLVFSPEREDPANPHFHTKTIPKVVGGITPACRDAGVELYRGIIDRIVAVSSPEAAEFAKILENTFRSINIALVNELKMLADRMNVDIWEVIEAASTKPFGFMPFFPGPGLGGHCIPIDPFYLSWKAKELNFNTHFIELAGEINTAMPEYVISRTADALNSRGKCLKNSRILILGIAYKKDVDDMRESPALEIIELFQEKGAVVDYHDPFIPEVPKLRKRSLHLRSVPLTAAMLKKADAVVIVTNHSGVDYGRVVANAKLVIDTRNATSSVRHGRSKIVKA